MSSKTEKKLFNQLNETQYYFVYILNDDYTSRDFCVRTIISVFHKTAEDADLIMHKIHTTGKGLCGGYTHEIAETKASAVHMLARKEGFPMKCSIEER